MSECKNSTTWSGRVRVMFCRTATQRKLHPIIYRHRLLLIMISFYSTSRHWISCGYSEWIYMVWYIDRTIILPPPPPPPLSLSLSLSRCISQCESAVYIDVLVVVTEKWKLYDWIYDGSGEIPCTIFLVLNFFSTVNVIDVSVGFLLP